MKNSYPESEARREREGKGCKEQFGKEVDTADRQADRGGKHNLEVKRSKLKCLPGILPAA